MKKKVGVVGAGPGSLAFCDVLLEENSKFHITIFEPNSEAGGLASSSKKFKLIEKFYHHIFRTDYKQRKMMKDYDFDVKWSKFKVGNFTLDKGITNSTSFRGLSKLLGFYGTLRILLGVIALKVLPRILWRKVSIECASRVILGKESWEQVWQPLLRKKFGKAYSNIDFTWLVSRIKDRTQKLGVVEEGFGNFWETVAKSIKKKENVKYIQVQVLGYWEENGRVYIKDISGYNYDFDFVFSSVPIPNLKNREVHKKNIEGVFRAAECCIVKTDLAETFDFYWVNLLDDATFFTVLIDHTKVFKSINLETQFSFFYLARYCEEKELLIYNNDLDQSLNEIIGNDLNQVFGSAGINTPKILDIEYNYSRNAQPIFSKENVISQLQENNFKTDKIVIRDMWSTFPHDRGQNYAVEQGQRAASDLQRLICGS